MDPYDDRPISVYDNLNTPPPPTISAYGGGVARQRVQNMPSMITAGGASTATNRPNVYTDLSFNFNDNNNVKLNEQLQQSQLQQRQSLLLPNGNRNLNQNANATTAQVQTNTNTPQYAVPFKSTVPLATTTATTSSSPSTFIAQQQRPLSQHSQSELNETSQNIAAVKAALNDAKSKFFGLNGYAQDNSRSPSNNFHNESSEYEYDRSIPAQQTYKLLNDRNSSQQSPQSQQQQPQVQIQIVKTPSVQQKPQPKYQNIPENSAIFRNFNQPPELPPKPSDRLQQQQHQQQQQQQNLDDIAQFNAVNNRDNRSTSPATSAGIDNHRPYASELDSPMSNNNNNMMSSTRSQSPSKSAPYTTSTTYKQIPLNDVDTPSQAVYMSTTVPQNIKGSKIAGRHTPTRNSLRHSRMLVVNNRNYQGPQYPNPMNFKHPNLARILLILQILIGLLISMLAIWIFFLAPNTAMQDNPYWSGIALLLAGFLGLLIVRYQRIKRHKVRENIFLFLRANSYLLSVLALLLCFVALICAALHFARITAVDTKCESTNMLVEHSSCICTFNVPSEMNNNSTLDGSVASDVSQANNSTALETDQQDNLYVDDSYKVEYRDMSCQEIRCEWTYILGFSITLNALGFFISLLYVILLTCCRHRNTKRFYSSVHTSTF